MFNPVNPKQSFPKLEEKILKFWEEQKIFEKSLEKRKDGKPFIFYEGPPTANGKPGIHHVLARVFKDVIPRFKSMKGHYIERKAGWDTHGLPVELEVEKEIGISGKPEIEKFGIKEFNRKCKQSVWKYTESWEKMTKRIGFWLDLTNPYITYTNEYIESVWWTLKQIWDKKLLYEDYKIVPYCCRCGTPLSSHEVAQGYKDITELTLTAKFKLKNEKNTYLLAWTTTPWTLIGNVALTVGAKITYAKIKKNNEFLILAKDTIEANKDALGEDYEIVEEMKGKDLVNKEYEPLFDFYKSDKKGWYIVAEDFVTTEDGTGVVHMALYGEDDYNVIKKYDLPRIQHVDEEGKLIEKVKKWAGWYFKEENLDVEILKDLADRNRLFSKEKLSHSYPFCWRCDTPLMYFAISSWFIKMSELKQNLIKNNQKINWYPEHIKEGRFGKWLEEIKDWALSRNRYWGTPLPIWQCECGYLECIGSIKKLKEKSISGKLPMDGKEIDLHRPFIDEIKLKCEKCDKEMRRVTEVIDCWFDSGAMPFAQHHYPFENKDTIKEKFPADYIAEAIDQTRGWFYTLLAIATLIFDNTAYKNVICLGHILDEHGKKMSKSKGNVVDPWDILNQYGADACRWYMYNANPPGNSRCFSGNLVEKSLRKFLLTLWNTYSFFVTYANIDKWQGSGIRDQGSGTSQNKLDKWILSELHQLIKELTEKMENYEIWESTKIMEEFIDNLSNWYIRRSRKRFWKSENDEDKNEAYQTLYEILLTFSKILAPFMPFSSEEIYRNLTKEEKSVHMADWPKVNEELIDEKLNEEMRILRSVVTLGHAMRAKSNMKVRQPLQKIRIVSSYKFDEEQKKVILEELNIKEMEIVAKIEEIAQQSASPDARILGPKYGKDVQKIIKLAKEGQFEVLEDGKIKVGEWVLEKEEAEIGFKGKEGFDVESEGGIVVALDTKITEELKQEGQAREIVRHIQEMRKKANYKVSDRINTYIKASENLQKAIKNFKDYIKKETLTTQLTDKENQCDLEEEYEIEGEEVKIGIRQ